MAGKNNEYLGLKPGLRFVAGPERSAIYEMVTGKIYSVDPFTTRILSLGMDNVPVDRIPENLRLGRNGAGRRGFNAFLHHPFVRVSREPSPETPPPMAPDRGHLEFLWIELAVIV